MKKIFITLFAIAVSAYGYAGGLLTNTNQNVAFLRNPSRDAAIGIDGVYSNPAGVIFLGDGMHISLNWQNAHQTRTVTSTFGPFIYGVNNEGKTTKKFEGKANAPFVPSLQMAYNKGDWSWQFNFSITGGGGKAIFDKGLGSFESVVSLIPMLAQNSIPGIKGYDYDSYLKGRQYYFGAQIGAARKWETLGGNVSGYVGARVLYGSCNYYGYVRNIRLNIDDNMVGASEYFGGLYQQALEGAGKCKKAAETYAALGMTAEAQQYAAQAEYYAGMAGKAGALSVATKDVTLNCDQTGVGLAPVVGLDYKIGKWNFAIKYDFKTKMRLENEAANSESANNLEALSRFADKKTVAEDAPALLTFGVMMTPIEKLRLTAGYHIFFDKQAKQHGNHQKQLDGNTFEYMFGAEYDICSRLQVSGGYQSTNYRFTDDYMSDISFNVSSYTLGCGFGIKVTDIVKVNIAYFQTNYGTYHKKTDNYNNLGGMIGKLAGEETAQALINSGVLNGQDDFTRTNKVFGVGIDITLPSKR